MNDKDKEKLSLSMYGIILSIRDNVTLPTHGTISKVLILSIAMLICSIISTLLHFYTFVSWQGCLVCVGVLVVLLWVERAQNDTLVKAYKAGAKYAKKAEQVMRGKGQPKPASAKPKSATAKSKTPAKKKPQPKQSTKKGAKKK